MGMYMVLQEIIDSELKSNVTVGYIIMVNTDNGLFDCHAERADQNRLLDTDINLSTVSHLSSDDELLIKCDENTSYMCDALSSVNEKIMESMKIFEFESSITYSCGLQGQR